MIPCRCDLPACVTVYSSASSWPLIKRIRPFPLQAHVGREVTHWDVAVGAWECKTDGEVSLWFAGPNMTLKPTDRGVVVVTVVAWRVPPALLCSAHHWLAVCHPDHSQEPSLHNHSSCWIIQSKQWPTFEVGNKLQSRPGVESGWEADWGRSGGRAERWRRTVGIGLCCDLRGKRRPGPEQQAWSAMWAPESAPVSLLVRCRGLQPPVNVIKQAGTRILQRAPILEASLHKECSSQKQGLTHVSHHQSGQCTLSNPVPTLLHSCYFLPFVYVAFISPGAAGTTQCCTCCYGRFRNGKLTQWKQNKYTHTYTHKSNHIQRGDSAPLSKLQITLIYCWSDIKKGDLGVWLMSNLTSNDF